MRHTFLFIFPAICLSDIFTATSNIEELIAANSANNFRISEYINRETARLNELKRLAKEFTRQHQVIISGSDKANPIKTYLLIRSLTSDWNSVERLMKNNSVDYFLRKNITKQNFEITYPKAEDLEGAALALHRLQDTYLLDTHQFASGIILGESTGFRLTSHDCFEIGKIAYNRGDHYHAILWMNESLNLLETGNSSSASTEDILEHLSFSLYKQGNIERALYFAQDLLKINPEHPRIKENIRWYQEWLGTKSVNQLTFPPLKLKRLEDDVPDRSVYEALCRGDYEDNSTRQSRLYCYLKRDRPFLRIAPIKVEILNFGPLVVIFRSVISDSEINVIQRLAAPQLRRATVQNAKTGALEYAKFRISKSAWLHENNNPLIKNINERIDFMTNLDQKTSEDLQIANYGIGGHYESHFDMSTRDVANPYNLNMGNRIATVLFYIFTVEKGGKTVFITENLTVYPSRNDALFWYNLRRDGEADLRTLHAACPVLLGTKWVCNKWIHERGQEFRRPCGLYRNSEEKYVGDLDS